MTALLGRSSDAALAARFHLSVATVSRKRRELGVEARFGRRGVPVRWTPAMDADLDRLTVLEMARTYGIKTDTVRSRLRQLGRQPLVRRQKAAWDSARLARLGRDSDSALAREWGVSHTTVRRKRLELAATGR